MAINKFWMIWCETRGTPSKKHETVDLALTEARRLATANPGSQFYVLESLVQYEGEVIVNSRTCSSPESTGGSGS